ncbi:hypothetical protein [Tabrizicola aquatica]|uniref:hypothetical protein n=1 Tax=Tabrizicola aquatica TaxID=909926 RepID=UPI000CD1BD73|nr:hypothetical protein [Tabrizicola aquatica]
MAIDTIPLLFAAALAATEPAATPSMPQRALDYDRIAIQLVAPAGKDFALARTCSDSWWKMSGIQLVTCMIAHPEDTFSPSDEG